jgi:hypothetical protein
MREIVDEYSLCSSFWGILGYAMPLVLCFKPTLTGLYGCETAIDGDVHDSSHTQLAISLMAHSNDPVSDSACATLGVAVSAYL